MFSIDNPEAAARSYAWYSIGAGMDGPPLWPDAGRTLLWRFAPAVEPRPRCDWLADFTGCGRVYPDVFEAGRAALVALEHACARGADSAAMCLAPNATVARLVVKWRRAECRGGLLVPAGAESEAVAPLPLPALYLPEPALERLHRIGLRQLGDVARLERGALDLLVGRRFAHIAFHQCRGRDVSPPKLAERPQAIVERMPVPAPGVSSPDGLAPYLEVVCDRLSFALYREGAMRAVRRLDLALHYIDGGRRYAGATLAEPTPYACDMLCASRELAERAHTRRVNVAAVEITASRFYPFVVQDRLFVPASRVKGEALERSVNRVRAKYGFEAIKTGRELAGVGA
ncbi:MAG: hypothetical protein HRF49_02170 [bacterium]